MQIAARLLSTFLPPSLPGGSRDFRERAELLNGSAGVTVKSSMDLPTRLRLGRRNPVAN